MRHPEIKCAVAAARLFIERAEAILDFPVQTYKLGAGPLEFTDAPSPKMTGALRRSSMELTRSLAEMRQS